MWLRFARSLVPVLAGLCLPIERRRAATEVDREVIELLWKRGQAQTTASRTRIVFDNLRALSVLDRVDARTVPTAGAMYATAIGIFSYAGVSFAIGRRFLERARRLVRPDDVPNRCIYRAMNFIHHTLTGDWSEEHDVDPELLQEGLRYGRLWEVTNVLNLDGNRRLYRGEFAQARERIEALAKIADQYGFDLAASAGRFLQAMLHLERRELDAAIAALDLYADEHPDAPFQISALGHRAAAQWLGGDVAGAEATLARAERILAQNPRVLPYHLSSYLRTRQLLDVHALEALAARAARAARRAAARRAKASRARALRAAAKVAWRRPEVLRSAGSEAWLLGWERAALRSWEESLAWAQRLGMRAEQARTLVRDRTTLRRRGGARRRGQAARRARSAERSRPRGCAKRRARETAARALLARIAATAVSAVAMGAAFPPTSAAPLAWLALAPWLIALRGAGVRSALALTWGWTLLGAWMVGSWMPEAVANYFLQPRALGWVFFFGVSTAMAAVFYMGFALVYRRVAGRLDPRLVPWATAAAWVAAEWGRGRLFGAIAFVSNPWGLLGYSQLDWPVLVQIASLTGVYGMGFAIVACNAGLAELAVALAHGAGWRRAASIAVSGRAAPRARSRASARSPCARRPRRAPPRPPAPFPSASSRAT